MDLKKNLCDNIKECELKIGYREAEIGLYYPESSLLELLDTDKDGLEQAISRFTQEVSEELGAVSIVPTQEKGRYCITVPKEGISYVHQTIEASLFLCDFIHEVKLPGKSLAEIIKVFYRYSDAVVVEKDSPKEWAVSFADDSIDPYIYYIEEDAFGLEYHRFTHEAYRFLKEER